MSICRYLRELDGPGTPHNPKVAGSNPAPAIESPASRRVFARSGLAQKGRVTTFLVTRPFGRPEAGLEIWLQRTVFS
jgi:hypothetical protein